MIIEKDSLSKKGTASRNYWILKFFSLVLSFRAVSISMRKQCKIKDFARITRVPGGGPNLHTTQRTNFRR